MLLACWRRHHVPGSPLKGVAMTLFGLMCGVVGTDVNTGTIRFSFGLLDLSDGLDWWRSRWVCSAWPTS